MESRACHSRCCRWTPTRGWPSSPAPPWQWWSPWGSLWKDGERDGNQKSYDDVVTLQRFKGDHTDNIHFRLIVFWHIKNNWINQKKTKNVVGNNREWSISWISRTHWGASYLWWQHRASPPKDKIQHIMFLTSNTSLWSDSVSDCRLKIGGKQKKQSQLWDVFT